MSCWALQSDVDSHRTAGARTRLCTLRHMGLHVLRAASHPLRVTMLRRGEARRHPRPSSVRRPQHSRSGQRSPRVDAQSFEAAEARIVVRCPGQTLRGIRAPHSGTEARQDAVSSATSLLLTCLYAAMRPRRDSSRTLHPGLWSARAHFPLVPTAGTWRREMDVVQSTSCHIHWLACSHAARVLHPLHAMASVVPVLRIALYTPLLDTATTGLICAADAAQFSGLHRRSTARAGERSRAPVELPMAATIRYCSAQERARSLQPRPLR